MIKNKSKPNLILIFSAGFLVIAAVFLFFLSQKNITPAAREKIFDGQRAYQDVVYQESLGPRIPKSAAHQQTIDWLKTELTQNGWQVEIQNTTSMGHELQNVIAKRGSGNPWIILGAHFDSRLWADHDPNPDNHTEPVMGANDGASGVAVLLELARTLPEYHDKQIWLVFFDGEDQGRIPGWDWILGSREFVNSLNSNPDAAVIIDMIGDADLNLYLEKNSSTELSQQIWQQASDLGYGDSFINEYKYSMLDDHTPFLEKGIPAVDIIDFDYPYWHTIDDTSDKVSPDSLQKIGNTLLAWLNNFEISPTP